MKLACGIDVETTGFSRRKGAEVIEIAAAMLDIQAGKIVNRYETYVRPSDYGDGFAEKHEKALAVNKIDPAVLADAPEWGTIIPLVQTFIHPAVVFVMHNKGFDMRWCVDFMPPDAQIVDTMEVNREIFGKAPNLAELAEHYDIPVPTHRALADAECCVKIAWKGGFLERYK